jgi:GNAT superfamily N-acetyltransferase
MHFLFGDADVPLEQGVALLMELAFEVRHACGCPVLGVRDASGHLVGVAYLSRPHDGSSLAAAQGRQGPASVRAKEAEFSERIGATAVARYAAYESAWKQGAPAMPHHYLGVLGVDPDAQGTGVGVRLLDEVSAIVNADADSHGTWLDTENPVNVAFYQRRGFAVAAERRLDDVTIWGMWKPAARVRA